MLQFAKKQILKSPNLEKHGFNWTERVQKIVFLKETSI